VKHLSQEQLDALVMGLGADVDESVRQHLAVCAECAARLAREAELESALYDVAGESSRGVPWTWRFALPAAAAVLIVVLAAQFLLPRKAPTTNPHLVQTAGVADPCDLGPGGCVVPPEDICRFVSVEKRAHPVL